MFKQHRRSIKVETPGWVVALGNMLVFSAAMAALYLLGLAAAC